MDEEFKKLAMEHSALSMKRMLEFETQEEKDAYMLAMEDSFEFMGRIGEMAEEHQRQEELREKFERTSKKDMSQEEKIQRVWESRMVELDELDGDTFSFFINRHVFGDDEDAKN